MATEWSGISSGTELLAYRGEVDPDLPLDETLGALAGTFAYPFRYGYSAVGRVVRPAGPFQEGQRVFAFHPHQDRFVADAGDAVAVDDLDPRAATLYPMVETALQVSPGRRAPAGGDGRGRGPGRGRHPGGGAAGPDRGGGAGVGAGAGPAGRRRGLRRPGGRPRRRGRGGGRRDRRAGRRPGRRGQRQPAGAGRLPRAAGPRGDGPGLLLVRHQAGHPAPGGRLPPPPAGPAQHPGVHPPGRPHGQVGPPPPGRAGLAALPASCRCPPWPPTPSRSSRPPRPTLAPTARTTG